MDRKWIAGAATLTVMACSGMATSGAQAQQPATTQRPAAMPGNMTGLEVEARVRDVKGDGTQLTVPKSQAQKGELKPRNLIKATYEERNGKKIVTSLRNTEGPQTGSGSK